ncbi:hypothetical protein HID58_055696 [Brassica napus]|uniref:Uncharacterized protein n=1 Tax=Brassica napus TaxID=3708 RepID=A0ABQ8AL33_BRANA|nr:hypothetical protein HID58_055696 [Brassica napus]
MFLLLQKVWLVFPSPLLLFIMQTEI